ncbi:MAG TPA: DUF1492 domain-containing protein [Clostridia bacterium]|nr:DUF1492 domain-containing protein [Clostridia bacterium]
MSVPVKTRVWRDRSKSRAELYFDKLHRINQRIETKREQIERLRELVQYATGKYTAELKGKTGSYSKLDAYIPKYLDMEKKLQAEAEDLIKLLEEARELISRIENPEYRLVLELRHIEMLRWCEICERMKYERRNVFYIHSRALSAFEKILAGK